jgi:hypothetical protein
MDQQHWDSEDTEGALAGLNPDGESVAPTGTFYVALKLALARLKEYAAITAG